MTRPADSGSNRGHLAGPEPGAHDVTRARGGGEQCGDQRDQGALAGTVRSGDADDLAGFEAQPDVVEYGDRRHRHPDIIEFDQRLAHAGECRNHAPDLPSRAQRSPPERTAAGSTHLLHIVQNVVETRAFCTMCKRRRAHRRGTADIRT